MEAKLRQLQTNSISNENIPAGNMKSLQQNSEQLWRKITTRPLLILFLSLLSSTFLLNHFCVKTYAYAANLNNKNELPQKPQKVEWTDLLPAESLDQPTVIPISDRDTSINPEQEKHARAAAKIQSSFEKETFLKNNQASNSLKKGAFSTALMTTGVRREHDNKRIRISGYVIPLEYSDSEHLTTFFFAPYFGACIHVPAPAPNQLIYVRAARGIALPEIMEPYWLTGILHIEDKKNEITAVAASAYSLVLDNISPYNNAEN